MKVTNLSRICFILCGIIVLLSSVFAECPVGNILNNLSQTCVRCVDVCDLARDPGCLSRCLGTTLASDLRRSNRRRRDIFSQKCIDVECADFFYCDPGVGECTPCDQQCDHHRIQGTTEQCRHNCPKYFIRMESTTSQAPHNEVPNRSTTVEPGGTSTHSDEQQLDSDHNTRSDEFIIGIAIIVILISLAGIAVLLWKRKYLAKMCRPTSEPEEQKSSLPCSQEGEGELINSRTPLTGPRGPIAQEKNFPKAESGNPTRDLGLEMGHPEICIPYTEVDGPGTHSTAPKTLC
ncbi:uncharacterized protein LOC124259263 [Haliotis rubra]|uniref:uncharacterized protein LOC124259263 n=1 Tax=Haliotis rubra TaxID=36100 RepID=UPI001EE55435|nr:uncharacterized protein LOC124259263 [Haliotis rubra]